MKKFSTFIFILFAIWQTSTVVVVSYPVNPLLRFSQLIDSIPIGRHFENLTVYHRFYDEIATGSLPLDQFKAMIQQDDIYVRLLFKAFREIAAREDDPVRKQFLASIGNDSWDDYFQIYYDKFNFTRASKLVPTTLEYSAFQIRSAKSSKLGVALATIVPCYIVWAKMGAVISAKADLINNPNHIYKEFIEANTPQPKGDKQLKEFLDFVDGYYDRLGNNMNLKQEMLNAYLTAVEHEYKFAESNYNLYPELIPPPKFSDLVKQYVNIEVQQDAIYHPLWERIGKGTLPFQKYVVLIQQDHIYMRSFYRAFQYMAEKERDPELKLLLTKDGSSMYQWFEGQYALYNFGPSLITEGFTREYTDFILNIARYGTVEEGLSSIYPCYFIWHYMGIYINELADLASNPNHPYYDFTLNQDPTNSTSMEIINNLINGYYERLDDDDVESQLKMIHVVSKAIYYEHLFANGIFQLSSLYLFN